MKFKKIIKAAILAAALTVTTMAPAMVQAAGFEIVDGFGGGASGDNHLIMPGVRDFTCPDLKLYEKVIFVGDSRTHHLDQRVKDDRLDFIAQSGSRIDYLKNTAVSELTKKLSADFASPLPKAVIFNHGVNDLEHVNQYMEYMEELAPKLKNLNCDLYYMSINPVDNTVAGNIRPERELRAFNKAIQTRLKDSYTYIDTYNHLMDTGFSTVDGLHYTTSTYRKIFNYTMQQVNAKKPGTPNVIWEKRGIYWYAVNKSTQKDYKNAWINYEGGKFYVDKNGRLRTNTWITTSSGNKYYVGPSGRYYTNQWIQLGGKHYYLKDNGVMARNEIIDGFYVGNDGAWVH